MKVSLSTSFHKAFHLFIFFTPYVLVTLLLYYKIISYSDRYIAFVSLLLVFILYAKIKGYTLVELGLSKRNFRKSLLLNCIVTLTMLLVIFIAILYNMGYYEQFKASNWFILFYIIVSCVCQEFLFRSIVYIELKKLGIEHTLFIWLSAFNYSFFHAYDYDAYILVVAFVAGLAWGYVYTRYPNVLSLAASHAIIGAVLLWFRVV